MRGRALVVLARGLERAKYVGEVLERDLDEVLPGRVAAGIVVDDRKVLLRDRTIRPVTSYTTWKPPIVSCDDLGSVREFHRLIVHFRSGLRTVLVAGHQYSDGFGEGRGLRCIQTGVRVCVESRR